MAKASTQFNRLDTENRKPISPNNKAYKPKTDYNNRPNRQPMSYNNERLNKPFNPNRKPFEKKEFKPKPQQDNLSEIQKLFMVGVASSMVFKIFNIKANVVNIPYYVKLVKHFKQNEDGKGFAKYYLYDVNKKYDPNITDIETDGVEVKSVVNLPDGNIEFRLPKEGQLFAEVIISKKYIMEAISSYNAPAFKKRNSK